MRDRLKELRQSGGVPAPESSIEMDAVFVNQNAEPLQKFFEQVEEIKKLTNIVAKNTKELEQLYTQNLNEPQEAVKKQRANRIDAIVSETNSKAIAARRKLQDMQTSNDELAAQDTSSKGASADVRTRKSQHSALTTRFVDVMQAYQDIQTRSKKELRNRQARELRIVSNKATDDEIENALDNVSGPIFAQQIEMASQREEAKQLLADIQSRHEDIVKLESSLRELRQLFLDMQTLVEAQGEMLNEIENAVDSAVDFVGQGVVEMQQAVKYQKKARTKMFILLGCVCCLVVVVVVVPVAIVVPKLSSH